MKTRKASFLYPSATIDELRKYLKELYDKGYEDGYDNEWFTESKQLISDLTEKICSLMAKTQYPIPATCVEITEFPINEISEEERNKALENTYEQAEQSIKNERLLKSGEYPKEVIMRLEESNRIGTIRADTVQELVRCKDCKHRRVNEHYGEKGYMSLKATCELDSGDIFALGRDAQDDDWFCADGERIEVR